MNTDIDAGTTVSFTGYRPEKMLKSSIGFTRNTLDDIHRLVSRKVVSLYEEGYCTYLTGMAAGFDLIAAEAVLDCRINRPDIRLIAVIPYPGQAGKFEAEWEERYQKVLKKSVSTIVLSPYKTPGIYYKRNDFLLDNSSQLICFYDGQRGGTRYTVDRALRMGHGIHNIFTEIPGHLF